MDRVLRPSSGGYGIGGPIFPGCYVRGMGVIPSARGHDIGGRLLQAVEEFALQNRLSRLYLSATPFLDRAISLYESFGFVRTDRGPLDLFGTHPFTMEAGLAG